VEWSSTQSDVSFKPDAGTLGQGIELASQTDQIVEAQSWVNAADGSVYLVTQAATATPHAGWQEFLKCTAVRSRTPTKP
jgi:large exoprotein involved in heme utilization and adhesion